MRSIWVVVLVIGASSQGHASQVGAHTVGELLWLDFGQTAIVELDSLKITFRDVISDSRCPLEENCSWEGKADIIFSLRKPGWHSFLVTAHIYGYVWKADTARHVTVDTLGYRITLMQLDPYPQSDTTFQDSSYTALVSLSRTEVDSTLRDFFPLHEGDYWEYLRQEVPYYSERIFVKNLGDTLMRNGKTYYVFHSRSEYFEDYKYHRMDDSARVFSYLGDTADCAEGEFIRYQFQLPDSTLWPICWLEGVYLTSPHTIEQYNAILDTVSTEKYICGALIEPQAGDTLWCPPAGWPISEGLVKGLGLYWLVGELSPPMILQGAIIDSRQYGKITAAEHSDRYFPERLQLAQNYPNPFNPSTTIRYELPRRAHVVLKIYNVLGQAVATLVDGEKETGRYEISWSAGRFASGVYLYRLQTGTFMKTKKMVLTR